MTYESILRQMERAVDRAERDLAGCYRRFERRHRDPERCSEESEAIAQILAAEMKALRAKADKHEQSMMPRVEALHERLAQLDAEWEGYESG